MAHFAPRCIGGCIGFDDKSLLLTKRFRAEFRCNMYFMRFKRPVHFFFKYSAQHWVYKY